MNPFNTEPRMPWYGYLIANVIVWIMVGVIYYGTKDAWFSSVKNTIDRPGTMSLLIFIPIAFLLASLYDYFFDRYPVDDSILENPEDHHDDEDEKPIPTVSESKEAIKP